MDYINMPMSNPETLKPCPFCKCKAHYTEAPHYHLSCQNDDCFISHKAIPKQAWNTRPTEDELRAEIKKFRDFNVSGALKLEMARAVLKDLSPWASASQEDPDCCQELKNIFLRVMELAK